MGVCDLFADDKIPTVTAVRMGMLFNPAPNLLLQGKGMGHVHKEHQNGKKDRKTGATCVKQNAFDIQLNVPEHEDVPVYQNLIAQKQKTHGRYLVDNDEGTFYDNDTYTDLKVIFQNEKYFKKYRKEILKAFQFKNGLSDRNKKLIKQMETDEK